MNNSEPRPLQHLRLFAQRYPAAWELATTMRAKKGKELPDWPDWCYLPVAAAYAIVSQRFGGVVPPAAGKDIGECAALTAWRATKGIYRFDSDLLKSLVETPLEGHLPDELLERLPEWCVYVELNGALPWARQNLQGFYAHLESDANNGRREMRLLLDIGQELIPVPIHLTGGNLTEGIEQAWIEANRHGAKLSEDDMMELPQKAGKSLAPLISLLLYLCSEQPDIDKSDGGSGKPQNLIAIKTKNGLKEFPASAPSTWNVGWRIGAKLRAASQPAGDSGEGGQASQRPHIRRAHWHTYLTGAGRARRELRWISPILVGVSAEDLPAVIHQ